MQNKINYINSSFDEQIAYSKDDLKSQTTIFFFGGYSSSMDGTKATALSKWCIENKLNFEMLNDVLPNQEYQFEECEVAYEIDPTMIESTLSPDKILPP